MGWFLKLGFLSWIISGLLLGSGFVWPILWPLSLMGGVMFFGLSREVTSWWRGLLGAWMAFSIKAALAILWLWTTYPMEWLPEDLGQIQIFLIGHYWLLSALAIGVSGMAAYASVRMLPSGSDVRDALSTLIFPLSWVLSEVVGSVIYSVVMLGPGGTINTSLSFSYTGYLLAVVPGFIVMASVAGVYGLSYLFGLGVIMGGALIKKPPPLFWVVPATVSLVFVLVVVNKINDYDVNSHQISEKEILVIDTIFPPRQLRKWEGVEQLSAELEQAVMAALNRQPDYLLLPEDARFFDQLLPAVVERNRFIEQYQAPNTLIVDSGRASLSGEIVLQSYLYSGADEPVVQVHKRYLVPQGEFLSYYLNTLLKLFGYGPMVEQVMDNMTYKVGPNTNQSNLSDKSPGILFCFESVDPIGVRRVLKEHPGAPFIAHPISHSLFHKPTQLWQQLDTMLRVQAVWNNITIISSANQSDSRIYSPNGDVLEPEVVTEEKTWRVKRVKL